MYLYVYIFLYKNLKIYYNYVVLLIPLEYDIEAVVAQGNKCVTVTQWLWVRRPFGRTKYYSLIF